MTMRRVKLVFLLLLALTGACTNPIGRQGELALPGAVAPNSLARTAEARPLQGRTWVAAAFLDAVRRERSVWRVLDPNNPAPRFGGAPVLGFTLAFTAASDSAHLAGFTEHEGGYDALLTFDPGAGRFCSPGGFSSLERARPFNLRLRTPDELLLDYGLPSVTSDLFRREPNFQVFTLLNRALLAGAWRSLPGGQTVRFGTNGRVSGLREGHLYTINYDFTAAPLFDAIFVQPAPNLSPTSLHFVFHSDTLVLTHVLGDNPANYALGKRRYTLLRIGEAEE